MNEVSEDSVSSGKCPRHAFNDLHPVLTGARAFKTALNTPVSKSSLHHIKTPFHNGVDNSGAFLRRRVLQLLLDENRSLLVRLSDNAIDESGVRWPGVRLEELEKVDVLRI